MRKVIFAIIMGLTAVTAAQAFAADEPANIIKYRQAVMKAIGGHTGAIAGVVKGEVSFAGDVAAHARGIQEMSQLISKLFPKGTDSGMQAKTRALPSIWAEQVKFDAAVKAFQDASANLVRIAEAGDPTAFGGGLQQLGKSLPRVDVPDKSTGAARFGIDVDLPEMLYGTVRMNPRLGGVDATDELEGALLDVGR